MFVKICFLFDRDQITNLFALIGGILYFAACAAADVTAYVDYKNLVCHIDFALVHIIEHLLCPLAMYFGLPIITSNRHGINDYSITGVTGYKYAPKDYDGFAEGLTTLLNDAELREKMGNYNKGFAQEFSVENSVLRMQEIYGELLGWIKQ